jgi:drug/metabolite transporter (DMT)-like permease
MTQTLFSLWLFNLVLDTSGQMAFKTAAGESTQVSDAAAWVSMLKRPWIWLGIGCYCLQFITWMAFVAQMPLSVAVLLSTFNIASVAVAARVFFGERPSRLRLIGIGLVALGVGLVGAG